MRFPGEREGKCRVKRGKLSYFRYGSMIIFGLKDHSALLFKPRRNNVTLPVSASEEVMFSCGSRSSVSYLKTISEKGYYFYKRA